MDRANKRFIFSVLFIFLVSGLGTQPLGSFIPFLRETFNLSYAVSGMLLSFFSTGNFLALLVAGILPAYIGRKNTALLIGVWMVFSFFLLAAGFGGSVLLSAFFFLIGASRGSNATFCSTMIGTLPSEEATKSFNLLHAIFAIGGLTSPLLLLLFDHIWPGIGWRVLAGLLAVFAALQIYDLATLKVPPEPAKKQGVRGLDRSFLRQKRFWLSTLILFFYVSAEYSIVGWLVTYFQDTGILSESLAQFMNSLIWVFIFSGRMLCVLYTSRWPRNRLLLTNGIGFFVFFLLMILARGPVLAVIGLCGIGFFMSVIYPTAFALGSDTVKGNDLGTSSMILIGALGGIFAPAIVGLVSQGYGIKAGMGVVAILTLLCLLMILLCVYSLSKDKEPVTASEKEAALEDWME